jgi:uncharacterized damage-inducible protein DinB
MKYLRMLAALALSALSAGLFAQATAHAQAKSAPSPFASAIDQEITNIENLFVAAAEAMPDDKFNATPETLNIPGSEFKGVRTFAAQIRHVAADNFAIWAPITGKPEPPGINAPNGPPEMKTRAEILKFLNDSFAYSHQAATNLTSENALEQVEFRKNKVTRISLVVLALTHINDHYGQIVEYLRINGVVPPASRPRR